MLAVELQFGLGLNAPDKRCSGDQVVKGNRRCVGSESPDTANESVGHGDLAAIC